MWLTGFDAPSLHTLYVDKPMRDHGLLQAIARVNRVFRDKPGGLVVDYIGIGEDLRTSLQNYDSETVEEPTIPLERAVRGLHEKHEILRDMFHPVGFAGFSGMSVSERASHLSICHNHALETDQRSELSEALRRERRPSVDSGQNAAELLVLALYALQGTVDALPDVWS